MSTQTFFVIPPTTGGAAQGFTVDPTVNRQWMSPDGTYIVTGSGANTGGGGSASLTVLIVCS